MKKVLLSVLSVVVGLFLVACHSQTTSSTAEEQYSATLKITLADDKIVEEKVSFDKEETVMDILEQHHEVEVQDSLVTSIDGVSQDASKNTYWMYDINGEVAPKGAKEMKVSDGDSIAFYLQTFK